MRKVSDGILWWRSLTEYQRVNLYKIYFPSRNINFKDYRVSDINKIYDLEKTNNGGDCENNSWE